MDLRQKTLENNLDSIRANHKKQVLDFDTSISRELLKFYQQYDEFHVVLQKLVKEKQE